MTINWFFYNFSNNVSGVKTPTISINGPALNENLSVETVDKMMPKRLSYNAPHSYQWLPILGGDNYDGCFIFAELLINGNWIKCDNLIIELDKINNIKNMNIAPSSLIDKIFLLQEWTNIGIYPIRLNLYIPTGKSVNSFFCGLTKID